MGDVIPMSSRTITPKIFRTISVSAKILSMTFNKILNPINVGETYGQLRESRRRPLTVEYRRRVLYSTGQSSTVELMIDSRSNIHSDPSRKIPVTASLRSSDI